MDPENSPPPAGGPKSECFLYTPSPGVIAASGMDPQDLGYCFNDFCASLGYAHNSPDHAFERLVTNLSMFLRTNEDKTIDGPHKIHELQSEISKLTAELAVVRSATVGNTGPITYTNQANDGTKNVIHHLGATVGDDPGVPTPETTYPAIGTYHTRESYPINHGQTLVTKEVLFSKRSTAAPAFPKGFTSLRFSPGFGMTNFTYNPDSKTDRCTVRLESTNSKLLPGMGCAWLEIDQQDANFQCEQCEVIGPQWRKSAAGLFIAFPRPYLKPPRVLVWFKKFSVKATNHWRICTYVTDITTTGFMAQVHGPLEDSDFVGIWWVAYTADLPGVCSGSVESSYPFPNHGSTVEFDRGVFAAPPRVIMVINRIELDCLHEVVVSISLSKVSTTGFSWTLDGLPDKMAHRIGASYIALK